MYPVNQVFLGQGNDPLLNSNSIDDQIRLLQEYKSKIESLDETKRSNSQKIKQPNNVSVWDEIDKEILPLSEDQKTALFNNESYMENNTKIQSLVQEEIISLVKGRIESYPEGKELLDKQLKLVKSLKSKVIEESNREMDLFKKFREFSKTHPEVTYDEFIKNM